MKFDQYLVSVTGSFSSASNSIWWNSKFSQFGLWEMDSAMPSQMIEWII